MQLGPGDEEGRVDWQIGRGRNRQFDFFAERGIARIEVDRAEEDGFGRHRVDQFAFAYR